VFLILPYSFRIIFIIVSFLSYSFLQSFPGKAGMLRNSVISGKMIYYSQPLFFNEVSFPLSGDNQEDLHMKVLGLIGSPRENGNSQPPATKVTGM